MTCEALSDELVGVFGKHLHMSCMIFVVPFLSEVVMVFLTLLFAWHSARLGRLLGSDMMKDYERREHFNAMPFRISFLCPNLSFTTIRHFEMFQATCERIWYFLMRPENGFYDRSNDSLCCVLRQHAVMSRKMQGKVVKCPL